MTVGINKLKVTGKVQFGSGVAAGSVYSFGGNFHGQSIAFSMDMLCIAVTEICNLSERRTNKLLDKNLNEG